MRQISTEAVFDPVAKTIDASGISGFNPARVLAIVDATGRATLYDTQTPGYGFASVVGSLLTLEYDTSALSADDNVMIFWDDGAASLTTVALNPAGGVSGQYVVTTGSVALPAAALANGVLLKSSRNNVGQIFIGVGAAATSSSFWLDTGESVTISVTNLSAIHILGADAGDVLGYIGN